MRDQSTSRQKAVAEFADREHGVAAHEELIRLGLSPSAVGRWAADGRLHRVHRGVYAIGRAELSREGRWLDIGVPKPELNVIVEGFVVDALWRAKKVIVELDSWTFHRSRRAFEEDRRRVAILQLAGYLVLPLTALDAEAARLVSAGVAAR
jgi:hypothetical protein